MCLNQQKSCALEFADVDEIICLIFTNFETLVTQQCFSVWCKSLENSFNQISLGEGKAKMPLFVLFVMYPLGKESLNFDKNLIHIFLLRNCLDLRMLLIIIRIQKINLCAEFELRLASC